MEIVDADADMEMTAADMRAKYYDNEDKKEEEREKLYHLGLRAALGE